MRHGVMAYWLNDAIVPHLRISPINYNNHKYCLIRKKVPPLSSHASTVLKGYTTRRRWFSGPLVKALVCMHRVSQAMSIRQGIREYWYRYVVGLIQQGFLLKSSELLKSITFSSITSIQSPEPAKTESCQNIR